MVDPPTSPSTKIVSDPPKAVEIPKATSSGKESVAVETTPVESVQSALGVDKPSGIREAVPPRDLGRGGAQHQAIQKRIKEVAEGFGFSSVIEKPVLDGQGSVDLWLERQGQTIACEISITTTIDHEVGNVAKCLKAGVPKVVMICLDEERLRKLSNAVSGSLGKESAARVEYFQPDHFIAYLKALQPPAPRPSETKYGGYKVRRSAPKLSVAEQRQKEDIAHRIMAEALRPER